MDEKEETYRMELLERLLREAKNRIHDTSSDFEHQIPKKGCEREFETAWLDTNEIECLIREERQKCERGIK